MLEKTTIARPYAQAAFEIAQARENTAQWSSLLRLLKLIVSDHQMRLLIANPTISNQQLQDIVIEICGDSLFEAGTHFIKVLVSSDRLQYAGQMADLFDDMRAEAEGVLEVVVTSAYPLEQSQEKQIAASMAKRYGKKIDISSTVDESLIGGVIIKAGDSVIDASLYGRLRELRNEII